MNEANRTEVEYVTRTLAELEQIGLIRCDSFGVTMQTYADTVVEGYPSPDTARDGCNRITEHAPCPRLTVLWVTEVEETGESLRYFRNAFLFVDHCFDVAQIDDHEQLLRQVLSTATDDWQPKLIRTQERRSFFSAPAVRLEIEGDENRQSLTTSGGKDFDMGVLAQLNSMIPAGIDRRFACFGDGGMMMVVWLKPEQIAELGDYCGVRFTIP